jgi:hypothetical protein
MNSSTLSGTLLDAVFSWQNGLISNRLVLRTITTHFPVFRQLEHGSATVGLGLDFVIVSFLSFSLCVGFVASSI